MSGFKLLFDRGFSGFNGFSLCGFGFGVTTTGSVCSGFGQVPADLKRSAGDGSGHGFTFVFRGGACDQITEVSNCYSSRKGDGASDIKPCAD